MKIVNVVLHDGNGGMEVAVGGLAQELRKRGHTCSVVSLDKTGGPSRHPLRRLVRLCRAAMALWRGRPDVVLAHSAIPALYVRACATIFRSPPVISVVHSPGTEFRRGSFYKLEKVLMRATAGTICVSPAALEIYRRLRPTHTTDCIPNGVHIGPRRTIEPAVPPSTFLFAGRLVPNKDLPTALAALKGYANTYPGARLTVAGQAEDPSYGAHLRQLVSADEYLVDHVEFLGHVDDVPQLMRKHDMLLHPSWHEAQSLTLLEAFVAGLPVAVTDQVMPVMWWSEPAVVFPVREPWQLETQLVQYALGDHRSTSERHALEVVSIDYMVDGYERFISSVVEPRISGQLD